MNEQCYHTVTVLIPDWEAVKKVDTYSRKFKYKKCVKCNEILVDR